MPASARGVAGPGPPKSRPRPRARKRRAGNRAGGGAARASADLSDADAAPAHSTSEVAIRAVDVVVHARQGRAPDEGVPDAIGVARVGTAVDRDGIGSRVLVRHDAALRSGVSVGPEQLPGAIDGAGDRVPSAGERSEEHTE